jgi:hypothetical protein
LCEFVANDRLIDQPLAKHFSFVRVSEGLFVTAPCESIGLHHEPPSLVIEIFHDVFEALVLFADQIFNRHLDIFQGDVRSA